MYFLILLKTHMSSPTIATNNLCSRVKKLERCMLTITLFAMSVVTIQEKSFTSINLILILHLWYIYFETQSDAYISPSPIDTLLSGVRTILLLVLFATLCVIMFTPIMRYYDVDMQVISEMCNISNITST